MELPKDFNKFKEDLYEKLQSGEGKGPAASEEAEDGELLRKNSLFSDYVEEDVPQKPHRGRERDDDPFAGSHFPFQAVTPDDLVDGKFPPPFPESAYREPERRRAPHKQEMSPEKKREMEKKKAKDMELQDEYYTDDPLMEYSDARQRKF